MALGGILLFIFALAYGDKESPTQLSSTDSTSTYTSPSSKTKESNDCLEKDFDYCLKCIQDVYEEELLLYRETFLYPVDKCAACSEDCAGLCTEEDCEASGSAEWTEISYECWLCTLDNGQRDTTCYNEYI